MERNPAGGDGAGWCPVFGRRRLRSAPRTLRPRGLPGGPPPRRGAHSVPVGCNHPFSRVHVLPCNRRTWHFTRHRAWGARPEESRPDAVSRRQGDPTVVERTAARRRARIRQRIRRPSAFPRDGASWRLGSTTIRPGRPGRVARSFARENGGATDARGATVRRSLKRREGARKAGTEPGRLEYAIGATGNAHRRLNCDWLSGCRTSS